MIRAKGPDSIVPEAAVEKTGEMQQKIMELPRMKVGELVNQQAYEQEESARRRAAQRKERKKNYLEKQLALKSRQASVEDPKKNKKGQPNLRYGELYADPE